MTAVMADQDGGDPGPGGPGPGGPAPGPARPRGGPGAPAAPAGPGRPAGDAARPGRAARRDPGLRPARPRPGPPAGRRRGRQPPHRGLRDRHQPRGLRHRPRLRPARPDRAGANPATPAPGTALAGLPARLNLTIPATALPGLASRAGRDRPTAPPRRPGRPLGLHPARQPGPPGSRRTRPTAGHGGPPDGQAGGRDRTGRTATAPGRSPCPAAGSSPCASTRCPSCECDHRYETHGYQPSDRLRHLVQVRDGACTFPPCSRRSVEAQFDQVTLWVLDSNVRARRFYEAVGWLADGARKIEESRGFPIAQVRYKRSLKPSGTGPALSCLSCAA